MAEEQPKQTEQESQQPLFFQEPVPLLQDRHKEAGIKQGGDFKFTQQTNSIPLNSVEFGEAAKAYPIVFTGGEEAVPVVVLGLETNQNLLVDKDGNWDQDLYIPAYARRYPFALSNSQDGEKLLLCVDEKSPRYTEKAAKDDLKFFDEKGEQTDMTKSALEFCSQYHSDSLMTTKFCEEIKKAGLLQEKNLTVNTQSSDKPLSLSGFQVVDEEALSKLSDEQITKFHKNGILPLLYFHLQSNSNWQRLVAKYEAK